MVLTKKKKEKTDQVVSNILNKEMNEEITHQGIDRSNFLGNRKPDKNKLRSIIIKFSRYNFRAKIFKNKRKLEGKRISVTESLTKTREEN